jgi:hypothetical protein
MSFGCAKVAEGAVVPVSDLDGTENRTPWWTSEADAHHDGGIAARGQLWQRQLLAGARGCGQNEERPECLHGRQPNRAHRWVNRGLLSA